MIRRVVPGASLRCVTLRSRVNDLAVDQAE
jgi:hypothetical protein